MSEVPLYTPHAILVDTHTATESENVVENKKRHRVSYSLQDVCAICKEKEGG